MNNKIVWRLFIVHMYREICFLPATGIFVDIRQPHSAVVLTVCMNKRQSRVLIPSFLYFCCRIEVTLDARFYKMIF